MFFNFGSHQLDYFSDENFHSGKQLTTSSPSSTIVTKRQEMIKYEILFSIYNKPIVPVPQKQRDKKPVCESTS